MLYLPVDLARQITTLTMITKVLSSAITRQAMECTDVLPSINISYDLNRYKNPL